jgi:phasin family protein
MAQTKAKKSAPKKAAVADTMATITAAPVVAEVKVMAESSEPVEVAEIVERVTPESTLSSPLAQGVTEMTDTTNTTEFAAKASEAFKTVTTKAKEVFAKGGEVAKEAVAFGKANIEAGIESGKIAATGTKTAAEQSVELAKKNWEATSAHVKALTAVKSPVDFFSLQAEFARSQMDAAVAETAKATEFYTKLAGEVVAPLQNRYAVVVDQFKARIAA